MSSVHFWPSLSNWKPNFSRLQLCFFITRYFEVLYLGCPWCFTCCLWKTSKENENEWKCFGQVSRRHTYILCNYCTFTWIEIYWVVYTSPLVGNSNARGICKIWAVSLFATKLKVRFRIFKIKSWKTLIWLGFTENNFYFKVP